MRVALVHDYLNQYGGGERVLEALCELWPQAPIYTLIYDKERTGQAFAGRRIKTSFLQKVPGVKKHHRPFLMLMPLAIEQFNLSNYDLVISDSASFAKGVITRPQTFHLCYCHTPTRYVWDDSHRYIEEFGYPSFLKKFIPPFLSYLRLWDEAAAARPDEYLANSNFVASRIKKYYGFEAEVVYPPVKTKFFENQEKSADYFLIVARLLSYKKIDLAIRVFNELGWPLKIIGEGPEKKRLQKMARSNIEFIGWVDDQKLRKYYTYCRAFIFPQEEDFGITAVEAMSAGRPVIAFAGGGALETVKEGETGLFFKEQTAESLFKTLKEFHSYSFDQKNIQRYARKFDKEIFKEKIKEIVDKKLRQKHGKN